MNKPSLIRICLNTSGKAMYVPFIDGDYETPISASEALSLMEEGVLLEISAPAKDPTATLEMTGVMTVI